MTAVVRIQSERAIGPSGRSSWWWIARCQICRRPRSGLPMGLCHPTGGFVRHGSQPDALATALDHIAREHPRRNP